MRRPNHNFLPGDLVYWRKNDGNHIGLVVDPGYRDILVCWVVTENEKKVHFTWWESWADLVRLEDAPL